MKITGWVSYTQMLEHMQNLSIGIAPMVDNLYIRCLTAPMKILDYLNMGLPNIAADLPSAREFIGTGKAGVFYKPGDV